MYLLVYPLKHNIFKKIWVLNKYTYWSAHVDNVDNVIQALV